MKKIIFTYLKAVFITVLLINKSNAQIKQVLYVNQDGVGSHSTSTSDPHEDYIIKMLKDDPNFEVTYIETNHDGSELPNLSTFDLIIAQENIISAASLFKPEGALGIKNITVPIIYSKTSAFRNGKAVTDDNSVAASTENLFVTVPTEKQNHDLFSGIHFPTNNQIKIYYETSNGDGSDPGNKSIDIINHLNISTPNTLLATVPEVTIEDEALVINYLPAGTQIGESVDDVLQVDAIALPFCYGPLVRNDGKNISSEALTIWRNAAYLLTGLSVPEEKYYNPETAMDVLYVNQIGVESGDSNASKPGYDPIIRMLEFDQHFTVTYVETSPDGSGLPNDLSEFELIIAQETISSDASLFSPTGPLGIKNISIPVIYNKTWAFTNEKAVTDVDAEVTNTQNLFITVPTTNQDHDLFSGIDFSTSNQIKISHALAGTNGADIGDKAIDVLNNLEISNPNTLLATVNEVTDPQKAFVVNYLPSGTQLGENSADILNVNAVALSFSYGALAKGNGSNLTSEALTIWRNAAYLLTGVPIPDELYENPALFKQVLYLNQKGVDAPSSEVSTPGNDPVIRMLKADGNFKVTYAETYSIGNRIPDPNFFDLVIAQETLSSGASFFTPGGKLSVETIETPIIYNKSSTFRNTKAVTDANATSLNTQNLSITVANEHQQHDLFSGIQFSNNNQIKMFIAPSESNGNDGGDRAIEITNGLDISTTGSLLATVPEVTNANEAVVFNYWPKGTQLGENSSDILNTNAFAFSLSYGATVNGDGENISSEALTMWRNASYILTGLGVLDELYVNPSYKLSIDSSDKFPFISSNIKAIGNKVYLSDISSFTEVNVYNMSGVLIKTIKTNSDTEFYLNSGIWITVIKTKEGAKSIKLFIK